MPEVAGSASAMTDSVKQCCINLVETVGDLRRHLHRYPVGHQRIIPLAVELNLCSGRQRFDHEAESSLAVRAAPSREAPKW